MMIVTKKQFHARIEEMVKAGWDKDVAAGDSDHKTLEEAMIWTLALIEAEDLLESMDTKDMAHMLIRGVPAITKKNMWEHVDETYYMHYKENLRDELASVYELVEYIWR